MHHRIEFHQSAPENSQESTNQYCSERQGLYAFFCDGGGNGRCRQVLMVSKSLAGE